MWELVTGESPVRGASRDVVVPTECPVVSVPPDPLPLPSSLSAVLQAEHYKAFLAGTNAF